MSISTTCSVTLYIHALFSQWNPQTGSQNTASEPAPAAPATPAKSPEAPTPTAADGTGSTPHGSNTTHGRRGSSNGVHTTNGRRGSAGAGGKGLSYSPGDAVNSSSSNPHVKAEMEKADGENPDNTVMVSADVAFRSSIAFTIKTQLKLLANSVAINVKLFVEVLELSGSCQFGVTHSGSFMAFKEEPHLYVDRGVHASD